MLNRKTRKKKRKSDPADMEKGSSAYEDGI